MTLPEVLLWQALRRRAVAGLQFRRQHPIGPYILDFYCADRTLAVEVDGAGHDHPAQIAHDRLRDSWLAARGITVLRFNALDILNEADRQNVLATIAARGAPSTPSGGLLPRCAGEDLRHILPCAAGEGDHAQHGGGGCNSGYATF